MAPQRILIAGGTGFIGTALARKLATPQRQIVLVTRKQRRSPYPQILWRELNDQARFDIIINLAGASIAGKRWSEQYKQTLLDSRLQPTHALVEFAQQEGKQPSAFINASAVGFYGSQGSEVLTETSAPSDCFSHRLCQQWEETLTPLKQHSEIRTCVARLGVVLDKDGGAYPQMAMPFKFKTAMQNGSGEQWFSWISLRDAVNAFAWLIETPHAHGTYNFTAPTPLTNKDFTQQLKEHYGCWLNLTLPAGVIRKAFGEMGDELLLASQRVMPEKLLTENFRFSSGTLTEWLNT